jgi:L-asparaginase/Glu-tRNA(Gln) amidotransferase subunit D
MCDISNQIISIQIKIILLGRYYNIDNVLNILQQAYELYDGFVVLHGTDTLAYTASALSFMFENLGKTIIITGAQVLY